MPPSHGGDRGFEPRRERQTVQLCTFMFIKDLWQTEDQHLHVHNSDRTDRSDLGRKAEAIKEIVHSDHVPEEHLSDRVPEERRKELVLHEHLWVSVRKDQDRPEVHKETKDRCSLTT